MVNIIELNVSGEQLGPNSMECNRDYPDILFHFSDEWDKMIKVAGFSRGDIEFEPQALHMGKNAQFQEKRWKETFFRVFVVGKKFETMLKTNEIIVTVRRE